MKATLKTLQIIHNYPDGVQVEIESSFLTDRQLKTLYRAKRKKDPKTGEVFYVVNLTYSDIFLMMLYNEV